MVQVIEQGEYSTIWQHSIACFTRPLQFSGSVQYCGSYFLRFEVSRLKPHHLVCELFACKLHWSVIAGQQAMSTRTLIVSRWTISSPIIGIGQNNNNKSKCIQCRPTQPIHCLPLIEHVCLVYINLVRWIAWIARGCVTALTIATRLYWSVQCLDLFIISQVSIRTKTAINLDLLADTLWSNKDSKENVIHNCSIGCAHSTWRRLEPRAILIPLEQIVTRRFVRIMIVQCQWKRDQSNKPCKCSNGSQIISQTIRR